MSNHPITPPPELVEQWYQEYDSFCPRPPLEVYIATRAAQWGWDQRGAVNEAELQKARDEELEACAEWLYSRCLIGGAVELRAARRPRRRA